MTPQADLAALATTVVASIFALAFAFGAITQRTNFCTMGSVADIVTFGDWTRMRQWLLAIAVAILGTNLLAATGVIDTADSFYTSPRFMPLAYVIGGLLFGFGMVLTGGCGSKSLVRAGGGSLKSLVVLVVLGIVAYISLRGLLAVFRVGVIEPVGARLDYAAGPAVVACRRWGIEIRIANRARAAGVRPPCSLSSFVTAAFARSTTFLRVSASARSSSPPGRSRARSVTSRSIRTLCRKHSCEPTRAAWSRSRSSRRWRTRSIT